MMYDLDVFLFKPNSKANLFFSQILVIIVTDKKLISITTHRYSNKLGTQNTFTSQIHRATISKISNKKNIYKMCTGLGSSASIFYRLTFVKFIFH